MLGRKKVLVLTLLVLACTGRAGAGILEKIREKRSGESKGSYEYPMRPLASYRNQSVPKRVSRFETEFFPMVYFSSRSFSGVEFNFLQFLFGEHGVLANFISSITANKPNSNVPVPIPPPAGTFSGMYVFGCCYLH